MPKHVSAALKVSGNFRETLTDPKLETTLLSNHHMLHGRPNELHSRSMCQPRRRRLYPLAGIILGLGAPLGALLLRFIQQGGSPVDFLLGEISAHPFFYTYMTLGTVAALALYFYLVGRRDDRLVANLRQQTMELQRSLETMSRMQKELVEKERFAALGLFSASVVHELVSPLDSALDLMAMVERSAKLDTVRTEYTPMLRESLLKIEQLINKLRLLSQTSADESREIINLCLLVSEVVEEITPRCRKAGIAIEVNGCSEPITLAGFHEKLHHMFLNLALNAIEAMPDGGRLSFQIDRSNGFVVTRISDTGIGIPEDQLDKLFTPFASTKPKGMGLGLTIAGSVVREHNGRISVESKVGKGTVVEVRLPEMQSKE